MSSSKNRKQIRSLNRISGGFIGGTLGFCVSAVMLLLFCDLSKAPLLSLLSLIGVMGGTFVGAKFPASVDVVVSILRWTIH